MQTETLDSGFPKYEGLTVRHCVRGHEGRVRSDDPFIPLRVTVDFLDNSGCCYREVCTIGRDVVLMPENSNNKEQDDV